MGSILADQDESARTNWVFRSAHLHAVPPNNIIIAANMVSNAGLRALDLMDDFMTTQEVARRVGVGPSAVKRWADAGVLPCLRTAGGHRRFAREAVERFLVASPGGAIAVEREPWVGALLEASDARALEALLLAERVRTGAWHLAARTAGEALAALGRLWHAGAVSILEEHQASERLRRALARACEDLALPPGAPVALLACAEGDDHTLGLSLVELVLREAGWAAVWAGRRAPIAELAPALARRGVRLVAVSASAASTDGAALRRQAEALGRICRAAGASLALGGSGAWPDRPRTGARFRDLALFHRWAVAELERRPSADAG
jgi:MerR family transcriptional regulator, light-induced transcriptional regulator